MESVSLFCLKQKVRGFPWSTEWRACMRGPLGPSSLYKLTSYNFPALCSHAQLAEELPPPLPGYHCPLAGGKIPLILQDASIYSHREIQLCTTCSTLTLLLQTILNSLYVFLTPPQGGKDTCSLSTTVICWSRNPTPSRCPWCFMSV